MERDEDRRFGRGRGWWGRRRRGLRQRAGRRIANEDRNGAAPERSSVCARAIGADRHRADAVEPDAVRARAAAPALAHAPRRSRQLLQRSRGWVPAEDGDRIADLRTDIDVGIVAGQHDRSRPVERRAVHARPVGTGLCSRTPPARRADLGRRSRCHERMSPGSRSRALPRRRSRRRRSPPRPRRHRSPDRSRRRRRSRSGSSSPPSRRAA